MKAQPNRYSTRSNIDKLHFQASISRHTTCASTRSPRITAYMLSTYHPYVRRTLEAKGTPLLQQTHRPTRPSHAQSLIPGLMPGTASTIRKGTMLTISLVTTFSLGYNRNKKLCKAVVKQRRPTSSMNVCHEETSVSYPLNEC